MNFVRNKGIHMKLLYQYANRDFQALKYNRKMSSKIKKKCHVIMHYFWLFMLALQLLTKQTPNTQTELYINFWAIEILRYRYGTRDTYQTSLETAIRIKNFSERFYKYIYFYI